MADRWFCDDDIFRLEAPAPVKAASRAAHSKPVHDCRIPLLSENISNVLCFAGGRYRDFRLLIPDETFSVCLARNIKISIRWIPSEKNSLGRSSREHDNANDATKSLVDLLK